MKKKKERKKKVRLYSFFSDPNTRLKHETQKSTFTENNKDNYYAHTHMHKLANGVKEVGKENQCTTVPFLNFVFVSGEDEG